MTTKHTPGPWKVGHESSRSISVISVIAPDVGPICEVAGLNYPPEVDPEAWAAARADARLIAAAPDLLEALRDVMEFAVGAHCYCNENPPGKPCQPCRARAAIAKATGGES